jgi:hypothetical protein
MTPGTCQTPPLARPSPVHDDTVDVFRHGHRNARTVTIATDPHSLRHQAPCTRADVAHPPASSPGPLRHSIVVVTIDLLHAPRPPPRPINRGTLRSISAHSPTLLPP